MVHKGLDLVLEAFAGMPEYHLTVCGPVAKEKDFEREKRFLAAWCKHFPSGNGTTYAKLVERAKKTGAIPG